MMPLEKEWDSLTSFPSEQLRTPRKESSSDHNEDQKKNYSKELHKTEPERLMRGSGKKQFEERNPVEAREGSKRLARIQKVVKGTATTVFWFGLQAFFWNTFSCTFMYWIMACIVEFLSTDPLLLHCTVCQCRHSKLEIKPGSKPTIQRCIE